MEIHDTLLSIHFAIKSKQTATVKLGGGFPGGSAGKIVLPTMQELQETWVRSLDKEDPLEEGMETHSSIFAWRIPWTEEPGRLHTVHRIAKS